ncbi:hypothetical protein, conserved [Plasmodium gonderi]|uniref:Uncharacterized protein n=1 Tax=Plasmodium gonderi TaxID=77519 RepID=A0A1Y1JQA9_PLAGO|nr:hypothetical protein, conserved [Plasmodium gonderi]GAW83665.1 hypothetical protein, conserved [Plasmodium gonderi]
MITMKKSFKEKNHFIINYFRKSPFYSSVSVQNFDLKANQQLLLSNVSIVNNENAILNGSLNFMRNFENFAVICCACNDPKNKVQLKKSIWFSSIGIEMRDFVDYCNEEKDESLIEKKKKIFEEIAKLECPVILKDKNTILVEPDVAPKKVVNSAKRMRYFFNISEVHTCRGCSKKNKCKRFLQKYAGEPDFSDFTRIMIGFYNICKVYTRRNETDRAELRHIVEKVNHFHFALFYIYNYLLKHKHFNYNVVEEGNRSDILNYLKSRRRNLLLLKNQRKQEKIMNIPREYCDVIIPTDKAKMKKRQRNVFEKLHKFRKKTEIAQDDEKFIWVEEQEEEDEQGNPSDEDYEKQVHTHLTNKNEMMKMTDEDNCLIEIQNENKHMPSFRFQYILKTEKDHISNEVRNYNKIYNKYTSLLEKGVFINLDDINVDEDIVKSENVLFKIPDIVGGYTFINYIEDQPNNYIFPINENLYKGIQVYKKEEINLGNFWNDIENESLRIRKIGFYNPFNIKQNLEIEKQKRENLPPGSRTVHKKHEEITELEDDLSSFQEYVHNKKRQDGKWQIRERRRMKIESDSLYSTSANMDRTNCEHLNDEKDEDARFAYFKKLRNEEPHLDQHIEVKEEFNSIYNDTYNDKGESNRSYLHTYHIRRKLSDDEKAIQGITMHEIKAEKSNLIQSDRKELKDQSFYICKNVKFPELNQEEDFGKSENHRKFLNDQLKQYIRPSVQKRNSNTPELTEETIEAHSSSRKGSQSLQIFLKKKKKHFKRDANARAD